MMKRILAFLLLWGGTTWAVAATQPGEIVQKTADALLTELEAHPDKYRQAQALHQLVREVVFPHFDFRRTARWVLGKHWRDASEQQIERFVGEFSTLMLRTYSNALREYDRQAVNYLPVRMAEDATDITVRTEIVQPNGPTIPVDYRLHREGDDWRVYDVRIDGVSLVITYRGEYASLISKHGLDGLIELLAERNRKALAAS